EYGSKHCDEKPAKGTAATVSADGKSVTLAIEGLQPTWGMEIKYDVKAADGSAVQGFLRNTIHHPGASAAGGQTGARLRRGAGRAGWEAAPRFAQVLRGGPAWRPTWSAPGDGGRPNAIQSRRRGGQDLLVLGVIFRLPELGRHDQQILIHFGLGEGLAELGDE